MENIESNRAHWPNSFPFLYRTVWIFVILTAVFGITLALLPNNGSGAPQICAISFWATSLVSSSLFSFLLACRGNEEVFESPTISYMRLYLMILRTLSILGILIVIPCVIFLSYFHFSAQS